MAKVSIQKIRRLIKEHTDWKKEGWESPEEVLIISLGNNTNSESDVLNPELVKKTLTYEGRNVTAVLDFDDKGYLVSIELV